MQKYYVFWIKEEFCYHYYYKSDILQRFLVEYLCNENNTTLKKQFHYISRVIPYSKIIAFIQNSQQNESILQLQGNTIYLTKKNSTVKFLLDERCMIIHCDSVQEADQLIFEPLKTFHPSFFIMGKETNISGWIAPVKKEILL